VAAGREHRVPLSGAAVAILEEMMKIRESDFVFPGGKRGKPLSNMAMLAVLKRTGRSDLTAHGFRSSFRDWATERTNFPREVAEMALAHTVGDKVEAVYRQRPVPEAAADDGWLGKVLQDHEAAGRRCADRQPHVTSARLVKTDRGG
jgi:integrase